MMTDYIHHESCSICFRLAQLTEILLEIHVVSCVSILLIQHYPCDDENMWHWHLFEVKSQMCLGSLAFTSQSSWNRGTNELISLIGHLLLHFKVMLLSIWINKYYFLYKLAFQETCWLISLAQFGNTSFVGITGNGNWCSQKCENWTNEPHRDKTNKMACAPSEDSDQPGHPPSLIRVFTVCLKKAMILSYPLSVQQRLWLDWADAQADLSLRWAHMPFRWFCHDAAQIIEKQGSSQWYTCYGNLYHNNNLY